MKSIDELLTQKNSLDELRKILRRFGDVLDLAATS